MTSLGVGILGCGPLAEQYLSSAKTFRGLAMRSCADRDWARAQDCANRFGLRMASVDDLMAARDVDIVLNLTPSSDHFETTKAILQAGKHVYLGQSSTLTLDEGAELAWISAENGLRIGAVPATFLGASQQLMRHVVDSGVLGQITSGLCLPDQNGIGPASDQGPDCIAALVQTLGPVERVVALSSTGLPSQVIPYKVLLGAANEGTLHSVIHAILHFESGAQVVYGKRGIGHPIPPTRLELFGGAATLRLNDPTPFGEPLSLDTMAGLVDLPEWPHPFAPVDNKGAIDLPCAGLAEMARSILDRRPHRCSVDFVLHVVEIQEAIHDSIATGSVVNLMTTCTRPALLGPQDARELLA